MRLQLSPELEAFREEMRTFFTTQVPQEIRDHVAARFGRDPQAARPFEGLRFLDIGCGGGIDTVNGGSGNDFITASVSSTASRQWMTTGRSRS